MSDALMPWALVIVLVVVLVIVGWLIWNNRRTTSRAGNSSDQQMENKSVKMRVDHLNPIDYQAQYVSGSRPHTLIDVRTAAEFRGGHIPGAVNIELDALPRRLSEIPRDRPAVFYCRSGRRSEMAANLVAQAGYSDVANLGGIMDWQRQGLPVR